MSTDFAVSAERPTAPASELSEPLSRNRDFHAFLAAEGISAIGDSVTFTALPLLVLALTGSGFAMGIVGALQTVPDLFFGLVAGPSRTGVTRSGCWR